MIVDANIGLGRFAASSAFHFAMADELLACMDRLGIGEALVYSVVARECGPESANEWLVRETAGHPRLHPCLTLVPADPSLDPALANMRQAGIAAGRVFPRAGHFSVRPWCLGPVAEGLLKLPRGVLLLDFELSGWGDESIDWPGVRELCLAYPALPVVVCGCTVAAPRLYDRLLCECRNLHIEISRLHVAGELERLCAAGFGDRVLFGSDGPAQFAGGVLSQVRCARLSGGDRDRILGGNLARLLGMPAARCTVTSGTPAADRAIDMHVHYGRWHHSVCGPGDADGLVSEMDRCGIGQAVLTSIFSCYGDVDGGNAAVAAACRRHPTRLFGYITIDPKHPDEMESELQCHGADSAFRGLKFHCGTHAVRLDDERYAPALAFADRRGWPVLIHHGMGDSAPWVRCCERYPNAKLLAAHAGGMTMNEGWEARFLQMCRSHANLYLDLASSRLAPGVLEQLVAAVGAERVIYGSDYPLFDFGYERGRVDYSLLSADDRAKILYKNAARLLGLAEGDVQ